MFLILAALDLPRFV